MHPDQHPDLAVASDRSRYLRDEVRVIFPRSLPLKFRIRIFPPASSCNSTDMGSLLVIVDLRSIMATTRFTSLRIARDRWVGEHSRREQQIIPRINVPVVVSLWEASVSSSSRRDVGSSNMSLRRFRNRWVATRLEIAQHAVGVTSIAPTGRWRPIAERMICPIVCPLDPAS